MEVRIGNRPHGSFLNQPKTPFPPSSRPRISNVANIENAVNNEGITTKNVKTNLYEFPEGHQYQVQLIGDEYLLGIEKSKNNINDNRASESEKIFPPIIFGTITYHAI